MIGALLILTGLWLLLVAWVLVAFTFLMLRVFAAVLMLPLRALGSIRVER